MKFKWWTQPDSCIHMLMTCCESVLCRRGTKYFSLNTSAILVSLVGDGRQRPFYLPKYNWGAGLWEPRHTSNKSPSVLINDQRVEAVAELQYLGTCTFKFYSQNRIHKKKINAALAFNQEIGSTHDTSENISGSVPSTRQTPCWKCSKFYCVQGIGKNKNSLQ